MRTPVSTLYILGWRRQLMQWYARFHWFCSDCTMPVGNSSKCKCPMCQVDVSEGTFLNNAVKMQVRQLKIRCPNNPKYCQRCSEICNKATHLQYCRCMECMCDMCGQVVPRAKSESHQTECPVHPKSESTACHESMPWCNLEKHYNSCLKFPQICPRCCSARTILRDGMQHHLSHDCPL